MGTMVAMLVIVSVIGMAIFIAFQQRLPRRVDAKLCHRKARSGNGTDTSHL
jgi:hydrogenase/urease accessory protein HupE